MKLRTRARNLFKRELSEHGVRATKVEHAVLHDLRRRATKVDDVLSTPPPLPNGETLDPQVWERLAEDGFSEFFGMDEPSLRARDKVAPRFRVNRELADKNARNDTFREQHSMTRGHVTESALGLLGWLGSLAESYGDELAEHAERQNEIADAEGQVSSIDDMLEELREQRNELHGDPAEIDDQIRDLARKKRAAVSSLQEAVAAQAQHAGDLIDATRRASATAAEKADEAIEAASLLPGKDAGPRKRVSPDLMIEFANRVHNSAELKRILDMMGRLELSMGTMRRQFRKGGYEEMVDIETGDDLRLVLPAEKALLTHPVAKLDFYRRYHERSLMQYEMWSEQELKRGPIIVAADGSDSMSGSPNVFCRGLTLACCSVGNREHRNTAAIEFGSTGELREFWFPGNQPLDTAVALDFAEHFFAGGTDINQVLQRAYDLIDNEAPFHSADLIIVTDGHDQLTDSTYVLRDALQAMGVKIHGLAINMQPTPYLLAVCDKVTAVFDFAGPNNVSDRMAIDLS